VGQQEQFSRSNQEQFRGEMNQIIAVASGKGGVGKSTVAVNLAVSLANHPLPGETQPKRVAVIDVDFYGPSTPTLMGGGEVRVDHQERFIPPMKHGVKYISIGFFVKNPDDPIIWRGPMFGKGIQQLFQDVSWGEVDICIVDMPPGTGDAQLSLSQMVKLDGAVIVTTPQEVALSDVRRAITMFRKVNVPVLGIVENMAGFVTPSGERFDIFGAGGGEELARQYNLPLLASLPLDLAVREGGDAGRPVALDGECPMGKRYRELSAAVLREVAQGKGPTLQVVN
jgi:ATP-binding protein involved in chromosome partitioning